MTTTFRRSTTAALLSLGLSLASLPATAATVPSPSEFLGIPVGAAKDQSRALASNLFPQSAYLFKRVKDDGRAEAALIAYYGAAKLSGVAG